MTFLAIDVGNTRLKWALYDAHRPGAALIAHGAEFLDHIDRLVASYGWSAELALLREVSAVVEPTVQAYHLGGAQFVFGQHLEQRRHG